MKKLPLSLAVLASLSAFVSAEVTNRALNEAAMMTKGVPARAVMDGAVAGDATVLAHAEPAAAAPASLTPSGAPALRAAPPAAAVKSEPGFFSKAWDFVKKPTFLVPAAGTLVFAAMGFMIAGPLGALTGAAIGGLLGFIITKAM